MQVIQERNSMRWKESRRSENVEDQRGSSMGGRSVALGGGGLLIILLIALVFGVNPLSLLEGVDTSVGVPEATAPSVSGTAEEEAMKEFVTAVLGETEDVWHEVFSRSGQTYREPKLVLYSGGVQSACGIAGSATGPFYCPGDEKVYLDMSFFDELSRRLGAPGDFAQAYVIAHEVGHHVQSLLGITEQVERARRRVSEREYNDLSVRLELQADFLAGVWAHHAQRRLSLLEPGDLEEALNAASSIGDDRMQRRSQGYVVPDAFTHGTSEQRVRWFRKGYETGDLAQGDTFEAGIL
jgi:predicted metalloprotease